MCSPRSRRTGVTQSMEYRTLAQVLSLATRARQVLLGLLSRQGEPPSPYLLRGYHCTYISTYVNIYGFFPPFFSLYRTRNDSRMAFRFARLVFLVLPGARDGCARGRRERVSVSPRSSRLYPARTVRWAPHRFRPLESSSCTRPMPLGNRKSRCKDCLGVPRI